ncbi:MAG: glycerophosphodiester phosphodiesterase [Clostridia bacterium]|nr:glycerophosphodiester phosphodiesterase [Clostridia bacterium]
MKTKIWAHRGASAYAPENSLESFALAIEMGAQGIELDIYETSDGRLVIHHDNNIKRMSGVDAKISETDFATLRSYNFAGEYGQKYDFVKIPEFCEVLELFKPTDMTINVEMKEGSDNYIRAITSLVREYGMEEQVIYSSFDHFKLKKIKEINPHAYVGALYSFNMACPWEYAKAAGFDALHPSYDQLYKFKQEFGIDYIAEAHALGIEVNPWTANKPGIIANLVEWGSDHIITDVPDIALEKVRENG